MSIPPYPVAWPDGLPRHTSRVTGAFKTTLHKAQANVEAELRRFGNDTGKPVTDIVMTSNLVGLGGPPTDPGVAVWFMWDGDQRVFAVDRYTRVEANLQAISLIVDSHRTVMRHGGLNIVRQTFRGFTALPAPDWTKVLQLPPGSSKEAITAAYRKAAREAGNNEQKLLTLNVARDHAMKGAN